MRWWKICKSSLTQVSFKTDLRDINRRISSTFDTFYWEFHHEATRTIFVLLGCQRSWKKLFLSTLWQNAWTVISAGIRSTNYNHNYWSVGVCFVKQQRKILYLATNFTYYVWALCKTRNKMHNETKRMIAFLIRFTFPHQGRHWGLRYWSLLRSRY